MGQVIEMNPTLLLRLTMSSAGSLGRGRRRFAAQPRFEWREILLLLFCNSRNKSSPGSAVGELRCCTYEFLRPT